MYKNLSQDKVNKIQKSKENTKKSSKNNKRILLIFNIAVVVIWMIIVFLFSNQNSTNSSNTSANTIRTILKVFNVYDNQNDIILIENLQNITRKSAHFILYTLGGFLIYNLVRFLNKNSVFYFKSKKIESYIRKNSVIISILFGAIYAVSDEIHQYFVPGRSCELRDMCIDTLGIILGVIIYNIISKTIEKCKKKEE